MRNWTGLALPLVAAWLLYSGLTHRNRIVASRRDFPAEDAIDRPRQANSSLAVFGDVVRPIIIFGLCYFALKATLLYVLLDAGQFFSPFDLAGLLFLVAAYGTWLVITTTYREIDRPAARRHSSSPVVFVMKAAHTVTSSTAPGLASKERVPVLQE